MGVTLPDRPTAVKHAHTSKLQDLSFKLTSSPLLRVGVVAIALRGQPGVVPGFVVAAGGRSSMFGGLVRPLLFLLIRMIVEDRRLTSVPQPVADEAIQE